MNIKDKEDLIDEIRHLDKIINEGIDSAVKEEWIRACDNLNGIKDTKKYWNQFSKLVGSFKAKVYSDLKLNGHTATTDQERSECFATHMENTCKTPLGPEFNEEHKNKVENHINTNNNIYNPLNQVSEENDNSFPNVNEDAKENKTFNKITVEDIKIHIRKAPNKAPGDTVLPQYLKMRT